MLNWNTWSCSLIIWIKNSYLKLQGLKYLISQATGKILPQLFFNKDGFGINP